MMKKVDLLGYIAIFALAILIFGGLGILLTTGYQSSQQTNIDYPGIVVDVRGSQYLIIKLDDGKTINFHADCDFYRVGDRVIMYQSILGNWNIRQDVCGIQR